MLGGILSGQNLIIYLAGLATVLTAFLVFKTRFGLRLRAAGYNADCLDTSGVKTARIRIWSLLLCGVLCGLAGAYLSLGYVTLFSENMSAGARLDIAGSSDPGERQSVGIALISLLFGFSDGLGLLFQRVMPSQFASMVPYVATLVALYFYSMRAKRSWRESWLRFRSTGMT